MNLVKIKQSKNKTNTTPNSNTHISWVLIYSKYFAQTLETFFQNIFSISKVSSE